MWVVASREVAMLSDVMLSPLLSSTPMSSQGNPPTLTLKLERDSSPFTPRSPQNFPVQLDISCEDEYEIFLAELRNAEDELGLAAPGLANFPVRGRFGPPLPPLKPTKQASGPAKTRKARGKGKATWNSANDRVVDNVQLMYRRTSLKCANARPEIEVQFFERYTERKKERPESTKESPELQLSVPRETSTPSSCQPDPGPREPLERDRTPGGTQRTNSAHCARGAPEGPRAPAPLARGVSKGTVPKFQRLTDKFSRPRVDRTTPSQKPVPLASAIRAPTPGEILGMPRLDFGGGQARRIARLSRRKKYKRPAASAYGFALINGSSDPQVNAECARRRAGRRQAGRRPAVEMSPSGWDEEVLKVEWAGSNGRGVHDAERDDGKRDNSKREDSERSRQREEVFKGRGPWTRSSARWSESFPSAGNYEEYIDRRPRRRAVCLDDVQASSPPSCIQTEATRPPMRKSRARGWVHTTSMTLAGLEPAPSPEKGQEDTISRGALPLRQKVLLGQWM
ncbi:hypothetical protein DFH06DRAFT_1126176 [Mycena polygramma]|nr:hypothetical protein DFH06DRAFT_1126176 [Mycena polygramma]